MIRIFFILLIFLLKLHSAWAVVPPHLRLDQLKNEILEFENQILKSTDNQQTLNLIQKMSKAISEQQKLGQSRLIELNRLLSDLEIKNQEIQEVIQTRKRRVHGLLVDLHRLKSKNVEQVLPPEQEKLESPKREMLTRLMKEIVRESEELQIDLEDAARIAEQIEMERAELAQFQAELHEQKQILALSKEVQKELIRRKQSEVLSKLKNFQVNRRSRGEIDRLMSGLNARLELQRSIEAERKVILEVANSGFAKLRGKFLLPVRGTIVGTYGKSYDPASKMVVFKKGIEILSTAGSEVKSIYSGTVAFTGNIPHYGLVALIDHGNHFYSLFGRLQNLKKKKGDSVLLGEVIAETNSKGDPIYFEIRAGNVALNPMQWLAVN